jgi:hypothetical protein
MNIMTYRRFGAPILFAAALAMLAAGCGDADDDSVPISGTVTFDGAPLPSGSITFLPSDGQGPTAGASITQGHYETRAVPGPKQDTITALREAKGSKAAADPHAGPPTEQYLPAKYNSSTELKTDVPESGSDKIDFTLTAK